MILRGGKEGPPIAYETIMGQAPKECRQALAELMQIPTTGRVPRTIALDVICVVHKFRRAKGKYELAEITRGLDGVLLGGTVNRVDVPLAFKILYFQRMAQELIKEKP